MSAINIIGNKNNFNLLLYSENTKINLKSNKDSSEIKEIKQIKKKEIKKEENLKNDEKYSYHNPVPPVNTKKLVEFKYNIHESLGEPFFTEYKNVLKDLFKLIPAYNNYFDSLTLYAWSSKEEPDPFPNIEGGGYIGGDETGIIFVTEVNENDIKNENKTYRHHSLIAHEYFHIYQKSLNKSMNYPNSNPLAFNIKWLIEGTAALFESLYVKERYNSPLLKNQILNNYTLKDNLIFTEPEKYEKYSTKSINYSSSVFMILVLINELKKLGNSEVKAMQLIFTDFMENNPAPYDSNWKTIFEDVFNLSVESFYSNLKTYNLEMLDSLIVKEAKLNQIFIY